MSQSSPEPVRFQYRIWHILFAMTLLAAAIIWPLILVPYFYALAYRFRNSVKFKLTPWHEVSAFTFLLIISLVGLVVGLLLPPVPRI